MIKFKLNTNILHNLLLCIDLKEEREYLQCINIRRKDDFLIFASTDGCVLYEYRKSIIDDNFPEGTILNIKGDFKTIIKNCKKDYFIDFEVDEKDDKKILVNKTIYIENIKNMSHVNFELVYEDCKYPVKCFRIFNSKYTLIRDKIISLYNIHNYSILTYENEDYNKPILFYRKDIADSKQYFEERFVMMPFTNYKYNK